jgi:F-type H+-transporting ATPase subunit delta
MKRIKQLESEAKHLYRLCLVDGSLDEDRVRRIVQRVLESRPRGSFDLLAYFRRLLKLECDRHTATVESATTLPGDLQTSVSSDLARVYGPKLSISFARNLALIGGMRIKVGSDVYDSSVKARLAAIERAFAF